MKKTKRFLGVIALCCAFATGSLAEDLTVVFDSATPTAPEGTASYGGGAKTDGSNAKLSSDGQYVEWVLSESTFTAASFEGYINTTNTSKSWYLQFSTDNGASWGAEVTQANDGTKNVHPNPVTVDIPDGANGIRVIRRCGTGSFVHSITLTTGGSSVVVGPTLTDIQINGTTIDGFKSSKTDYKVKLEEGENCNITYTSSDPSANVSVSNDGDVYTLVVSSNDGSTTYTITITRVPVGGTDPVPATELTIHKPEKYELTSMFGGYGGTLAVLNNREYEVYYLTRFKLDGSSYSSTVSVAPVVMQSTIISTKETETSFESKDGWFIGKGSGISSKDDNTQIEEFAGMHLVFKMKEGDSIALHFSGFDQFRLLARDNNADVSKGKYLQVYVDGVLQAAQTASTQTVRSYDVSSGEHLVVIKGLGGSNNEVYGWSLRLTNDPLVKHYEGNDSTQEVNQTEMIQPIRYRIKNYVASKMTWLDGEVPGITAKALNAKGDTLQIEGVANAPVGKYRYRIDALDANNKVTSSEVGTFTIKAELRADTTNTTVWINDPMEFSFDYIALSADMIHFTWTGNKPAGLTTAAGANNTYVIKGTPTAVGTYPYTISIDGGNTLSGTIYVEIPAPQFIAPDPIETHVKAGDRMNNIVWKIKFASSATVTGLPNGVTGTYSNGNFVISGVPATLPSYPQTFDYTITATPEYAEKESTTAKGVIVVIDPNAKSLLYLYKDNYNDQMFKYLNGRYDVTARATDQQMRPANEYNYYDVIVISENVDATNKEVLDIVKKLNKPILNMKAFTYSSSRLDWGNPDNGSVSNTSLLVTQPSHPIFAEHGYTEVFTLRILSGVDVRGIQPVEVTLKKSFCLAAAPTRGRDYESDGDYQTAIHEVPGNLRGSGITARYLMLPISQKSIDAMNLAAKNMVDACIAYLTDNSTGYTPELPALQIMSFRVAGVDATIDESAKKITCIVPDGTDLSSVVPVITLADNTTHTVPGMGEAVDFSDSHFGVDFVVSDFINSVKYNVICRTATALEQVNSLSGVTYNRETQMLHNPEGHLIYIYDVMGKLVTATNTDMSLSSLPSGMYLLQSADAMMKILK